jgi:hypothetical protein
VPVVNVLAPKVRVIAEAVVEGPPATTWILPKSLEGFKYVPVVVPAVVTIAASNAVLRENPVTESPDPEIADTL